MRVFDFTYKKLKIQKAESISNCSSTPEVPPIKSIVPFHAQRCLDRTPWLSDYSMSLTFPTYLLDAVSIQFWASTSFADLPPHTASL